MLDPDARHVAALRHSPRERPVHHALPENSPVVVLISTFSPLLMYSGTMISMPVESRAGFGRLVAVPPFISGGVSMTSSVTVAGSCSATGASSMVWM